MRHLLTLLACVCAWIDKAVDPGAGSLYEARLNTGGSTDYFFDSTHPNNGGYGVLSEHWKMLINANRRSGF